MEYPGPIRFRNLPSTHVLGFTVPVATTPASRLLGLSFLDEGVVEGLLIPRCRSVHTFGMRFPLDLVFLAADGRVLEIRRSVPPWRFVRCRGASAVLELATG